ncbi:MAG: hypothetical protein ACX939_08315, partial [Hyphococcus sp.]
AALTSCLVSEEAVLDASSGKASPIPSGAYAMCPVSEEDDACANLAVSRDDTGLYTLQPADDDPAQMRFRRIARNAYAVQSFEGDGYVYYYGRAQKADSLVLTMMMCADLPEKLRARLIERGDLTAEDPDFQTCVVHTRKALTDAARAYHRGQAQSDEPIAFTIAPAKADE